jgi:peptide deformylase
VDSAEPAGLLSSGDAFVAELARWRLERGLSKKQLAARMGFDPSYVSHVEAGRHRPTEDFARRAEHVLQAGGAIWQRFREYDELRAAGRSRSRLPGRDPPVPEQWLPPVGGLIVEQETAQLSYLDGGYHCVIRRALNNAGTEPVTRYLIRVSVDLYPNDSELSNRYHRDNPLTLDELRLAAYCGGEPMLWRPKHDRDADKEIWLLFENDQTRFPLYPGHQATIEYAYRVGADKWGQWFQRAVRLPTRRLVVRLDFPAGLAPVVWGVENSLSTEAVPLRTPIGHEEVDDRAIFSWATDAPALHARYRLEWRFRSGNAAVVDGRVPEIAGSERMRAAGIVQRGAAVLYVVARPLDLPADEALARQVVARLFAALDQVGQLHPFVKGVGLAAPQLGVGLAAAVVLPPGRGEPIVLLNPRVVDSSSTMDEQYEGCLSFFDVRGRVKRPLWIDVERTLFTGEREVVRFEQAAARLVGHEIDHLHGRLYPDRMAPDAPLVPVEEYREAGNPWRY